MDRKTLQVLASPKTFLRGTIFLAVCSLLLAGCQGAAPTPAAPTLTMQPVATPQAASGEDSIRITKYPENYTAFKIELQGGATIITDPFVMDEQVHADIVTESHDHLDHTDTSHILEPYTLLTKPGSFELAGVKITGVAGLHNKPQANPYDNFAVRNVIYVFDLGSIRLAQFASQGELPTPAMFAQIGKVDVLIIQIFSHPVTKLSKLDGQNIVTELAPRVIIPAHGSPEVNEEFAHQIGADFKAEPSGILNLTRSELDQIKTPVVIVLDH